MIKVVLGNSVINQLSSRLLSGDSRILKPVTVLILISIGISVLGLQQIFMFFNPRNYIRRRKQNITQYRTA